MPLPDVLLKRLQAIATSFSLCEGALALISFGSVGLEQERLDVYSDLDFFVVVAPTYKRTFLENINWLERVQEIGFRFSNTPDGYKLMFVDGVFCELAVFEVAELAHTPRPQGKLVWAANSFDPLLTRPVGMPPAERPLEWLLGEALTNLYVGAGRFRRGEKLSAMRFVQGYALDRVLELAARIELEVSASPDPFAGDRRIERRFPNLASRLPQMAQGYDRTLQSATEILFYLEDHFPVNQVLAREIRRLVRLQH